MFVPTHVLPCLDGGEVVGKVGDLGILSPILLIFSSVFWLRSIIQVPFMSLEGTAAGPFLLAQ